MQYLKNHPASSVLIGLYVLLTAVVGIYALTCDTQWCSLALIIPLTPWPQLLEGALGLNLPKFLLPGAVLLNALLLKFLGQGLEKLFTSKHK